MNYTLLLTVLTTGFTISFFHASIPTHWLPFVLAAKAQKWDVKKTLGIVLLAGTGHILMTTILGMLIVWVGLQINETVGNYFSLLAGSVLLIVGFYYILNYWKGNKHQHIHIPVVKGIMKLFPRNWRSKHDHNDHHDHAHGDHDHSHGDHHHDHQDEGMTILGLFLLLTFSPCEGFLPVYVSGISFGWVGFLLLTVILGIGTLCGMLIFTWIAYKGVQKIDIKFIEEKESLIMGCLLILLGVLIFFID